MCTTTTLTICSGSGTVGCRRGIRGWFCGCRFRGCLPATLWSNGLCSRLSSVDCGIQYQQSCSVGRGWIFTRCSIIGEKQDSVGIFYDMVERILHRRNIQHQTAVERCIQPWTGSLTETSSDKVKMQKKRIPVVGILFCMLIVVWFLGNWLRVVRQIALWDTTRIRFDKFASLFAFVLFAGSCVVRISYESFLDFGFSDFFMFPEWRTAFSDFS